MEVPVNVSPSLKVSSPGKIEPNFWIAHNIPARVLIRQKRFDEAISEAKKTGEFSGGNSEAASLAGYALAKSERRDAAPAMLEELKSRSNRRYVPAYNIAMIYNGLSEREETLINWKRFPDARRANDAAQDRAEME